MKKRKILYISGTRADYGLMRRTLFLIRKHPKLKIEIAVTGMHLMEEFGKTITEIKKDKFKIHQIKAVYKGDDKASMVNFIGDFILKLTRKIKTIKPDIILLLGDRAEMLGAAIVGNYLVIPIAHIQGGDVTSTVDEVVRHAITKLAHLHLPATKKAAQRIIKMGEDPWRIFAVGAPGLDDIKKMTFHRRKDKPLLIVLQHPVTLEIDKSGEQIRETMEAVRELGYSTVVIYPNADAGGRKMIKVIERYRKYPFIKIFKNISRNEYLSLISKASCLVGNSSSGIIEACSLKLPVVNIGSRQNRRERAENVIDVSYKREQIKKAVKKTIYSKKFKEKVKKCKNLYGDGRAGIKIARILSKIKIDKELLDKKITY